MWGGTFSFFILMRLFHILDLIFMFYFISKIVLFLASGAQSIPTLCLFYYELVADFSLTLFYQNLNILKAERSFSLLFEVLLFGILKSYTGLSPKHDEASFCVLLLCAVWLGKLRRQSLNIVLCVRYRNLSRALSSAVFEFLLLSFLFLEKYNKVFHSARRLIIIFNWHNTEELDGQPGIPFVFSLHNLDNSVTL